MMKEMKMGREERTGLLEKMENHGSSVLVPSDEGLVACVGSRSHSTNIHTYIIYNNNDTFSQYFKYGFFVYVCTPGAHCSHYLYFHFVISSFSGFSCVSFLFFG